MSRRLTATNVTWREVGGLHLGRWNPGPELRKWGFRAIDLWASPPGPRLPDDAWQAAGFAAAPEGGSVIAQKVRMRAHNLPLPKSRAEAAGLLLTQIAVSVAQQRREAAKQQHRPLTVAADAPRRRNKARQLPARQPSAMLTCNDVFDDFIAAKADELTRGELSANYFNNLRQNILNLRVWCGGICPLAFTKEILEERHRRWRQDNGPAAAEKLYGALRTALSWADGRERFLGWIPPAATYTKLNLPKAGKRLRVGTPQEMEMLRRAFDDPGAIYDELGLPAADRLLAPLNSGGDALTLLLWTCARVGDGLGLRHENIIETSAGPMVYFRPSKSRRRGSDGKWLTIPILAPLKQRLDDIAIRQRRHFYQGPYLVVREDDRLPYIVNDPNDPATDHSKERKHQRFTAAFNERRDLAARLCPSLGGEGRDQRGRAILPFKALDTRDTAATRIYSATGNLEEVAVFHGSSSEELVELFGHYIEVQPEFAREVGNKLQAWCDRHGIKI